MTRDFANEQALSRAAAAYAAAWHAAGLSPLVIALCGDLGAGKTTWARAMLRGLGHHGRVPSPTYTLVEIYAIAELTVVHVDLYRLGEADESEHLGLRDWLAEPAAWMLIEWPERDPDWLARADLAVRLRIDAATGRRVTLDAITPRGRACVDAISQVDSK